MDELLGTPPFKIRLVVDRRGPDDLPTHFAIWTVGEDKHGVTRHRLRISTWSTSVGPTDAIPQDPKADLPGYDPRKRASLAMTLATLAHERCHIGMSVNAKWQGNMTHDLALFASMWGLAINLWWPNGQLSAERIALALARARQALGPGSISPDAVYNIHDDALVDLLWEDFPRYRKYLWASPQGEVEIL
jgi:hypothetical protein